MHVSVLSFAVWLVDYEFFNRDGDRWESVRELFERCRKYWKERDKLSDELRAAVDKLGELRDKESHQSHESTKVRAHVNQLGGSVESMKSDRDQLSLDVQRMQRNYQQYKTRAEEQQKAADERFRVRVSGLQDLISDLEKPWHRRERRLRRLVPKLSARRCETLQRPRPVFYAEKS